MSERELPTLVNGSVTLRPPVAGELDELAVALSTDDEASPWLGTDASVTAGWFHAAEVGALVVEWNGRPAGVVTYEESSDPDYHFASIDIGLLSHAVDRGVGTSALRTLIRWLIDARGHHRITIDPAAGNARAIRAYKKVGFRPVGIMRECERGSDGVWHDNLLMDLLARELVE